MSEDGRITRLTVRSIWPEKSPLPEGVPEFSTQEIALAAAYCDPLGYKIILHKYVFNHITERQCPDFYRDVWGLAVRMAIDKGWDDGPRGQAWYRRIAHAALYEVLEPMKCFTCKGAQFVEGRPCRPCDATGRRSLSDADRAEALEIPAKDWKFARPPWRDRYEMVYRRLADSEGIAWDTFRRELSDD